MILQRAGHVADHVSLFVRRAAEILRADDLLRIEQPAEPAAAAKAKKVRAGRTGQSVGVVQASRVDPGSK